MNPKMIISVLMVLILVTLAVTSCTAGTQIVGQVHGLSPAPDLGVMADKDFRVVDMIPNGPVAVAGAQIGDVLLDLTWIPSDAPMYIPEHSDVLYLDSKGFLVDPVGNPYVDATGRRLTPDDILLPEPGTDRPPVVPPVTIEVQPGSPTYTRPTPLPAADYIEKDTIPFAPENRSRITSMAGYGVPLKLRVQRGDQVLELTVTPTAPGSRYIEPEPGKEPPPTPTPISSAYYF